MPTHVPKSRRSEVRPGSLQSLIAAHFLDCTRETKGGVTVAEARAAWTRRMGAPPPKDFACCVLNLAYRGILVVTGGHRPRTRYAHLK